jgi:hypothetical protein
VRARELASLEVELAKPITADLFTRWAGGSVERISLLAYSVWGSIRWPRSLGKPYAPSLAGGFLIEHQYYKEDWRAIGGGKVVDWGLWLPLEEPSKWDGQEDSDHYVVNFMTRAPGYYANKLEARFAPGIGWQRGIPVTLPGIRHIQPIFYRFKTLGEVVVLDPFEAVERPIITWNRGTEPEP